MILREAGNLISQQMRDARAELVAYPRANSNLQPVAVDAEAIEVSQSAHGQ